MGIDSKPKYRQLFSILPEAELTFAQQKPSENTEASCPLLCALLRSSNLPFQETYTQRQVAAIFRKDARTVRSWTSEGRLAVYNLGGVCYFAHDLEAFIRASRRNNRMKGVK